MPNTDVHVPASPVRCPFCHDGIQTELEPWIACAGCLARHHSGCWKEGGSKCAACGAAQSLLPTAGAPARSPAATFVGLALTGEAVVLLAAGVGLLLRPVQDHALAAVATGLGVTLLLFRYARGPALRGIVVGACFANVIALATAVGWGVTQSVVATSPAPALGGIALALAGVVGVLAAVAWSRGRQGATT